MSWVQRGLDIGGEAPYAEQFGYSISLSADGSVVAIGAPTGTQTNEGALGHVRIYVWNGTTWTQRGLNIVGEAAGDWSGSNVSLSADGSVVAICAITNWGENGVHSGHARVYAWNGTAWVQRGLDIDGEAAYDKSGFNVSLSADGTIVAIGAIQNSGTGIDAGHVRVYTWNGTAWVQRGADIDGEAAYDKFGNSVSLSSYGTVLAIGAPGSQATTPEFIPPVISGYVRIYTYVPPTLDASDNNLPGHVAVEVNFNVAIDADSKVFLFGEAAPTMLNVIVAEQTLPVTALYDASGSTGLIELWEPSAAQGNIRCQLANDGGEAGASLAGAYQLAAAALASGLQAVLQGAFDCSGATPFDGYAANIEYYKQDNFGRVALGAFAHYLFGHVDATAAITNDEAFVTNMLAQVTPAGNVETWDFTASIASANLANRLVKEIIAKGKAAGDVTSATLIPSDVSGGTAPAGSLAEIVKQVIGQDSSRVQNADGSQRTLDKHILLRFFAGDVIYVKINVLKPTVEVSGTGANPPANSLVLESETSYNLKITLA